METDASLIQKAVCCAVITGKLPLPKPSEERRRRKRKPKGPALLLYPPIVDPTTVTYSAFTKSTCRSVVHFL